MSSPEEVDVETGPGLVLLPGSVPGPRGLGDAGDPWLRIGAEDAATLPAAGQPGHGRTAFLRRRPVRIAEGRAAGGYTSVFELICPGCGDHPYLDYVEVPARLQRLRGPWTLQAGLAAYDEHLGLLSRPDGAATPGAGDVSRTAAQVPLAATSGGYRHEALLYCGMAEFLTGTTSFIRRAVTAGDPVLVVLSGPKIGLLRRELGADAGRVTFADMADAGANPGRLIATWRRFAQVHAGASQLWGIGEPAYPGRSAAELAECELVEALLNVAFEASTPFWLLCPYDLDALPGQVIAGAHRTHPFLARGRHRQPSRTFRPVNLADPFARPLPARPADAARMAFGPGELGPVQAFAALAAQQAGLDDASGIAVIRAVREIAANSLRHGGGHGELRTWTDGHSLICEVSDHGHITTPLAGRLPPSADTGPGAGLWLANQLCDLVRIHSRPGGSVIRLHQNL